MALTAQGVAATVVGSAIALSAVVLAWKGVVGEATTITVLVLGLGVAFNERIMKILRWKKS